MFQSCWDRSSWVEQVLSRDKVPLGQGDSEIPLVRLEPATPPSRVKHHSTTEPLRASIKILLRHIGIMAVQREYIETGNE